MAKKKAPNTDHPVSKSRRPLAAATRLQKTADRIAWTREAQKQAVEMYAEARQAGSYVAAEKCLRSARELGEQLAILEKLETEGKGSMTEAEFVAVFQERLAALPLPYLEMAVEEYLRRIPGVRMVSANA